MMQTIDERLNFISADREIGDALNKTIRQLAPAWMRRFKIDHDTLMAVVTRACVANAASAAKTMAGCDDDADTDLIRELQATIRDWLDRQNEQPGACGVG